MGFIILLFISALAVASSAAFFSVYGLGQIFAASFIPVLIMGGSLEVGKLVAASFLYRFWGYMPKSLKVYMSIAVLMLMLITSVGIFGFLTASYQKDSIGLGQQEQTIALYEDQKVSYQKRLDGINKQIEAVPEEYITKRMELIGTFEAEKTDVINKISGLDSQLLELKTTVLQTEAKIGPIIYVAKRLNKSPDEAIFWFVLLIIGVFDPFAVSLTIGTNIALRKRKEDRNAVNNNTVSREDTQLPMEEHPVDTRDDIIEHPTDVSPGPLNVPESSPTPTPTMEVEPTFAPSTDMSNEINAIKKLIMDSNKSEDITRLYESFDTLSKEFKKSRIRDELGNVHRN